ncbi:MAG: NUDIX hydrolase [Gammaproteobacteria bacterium]|jgi:8-oxo-dGTP pyrophosphatase MutT (NUDIX family)|nr:NUDIX hydrolase [Gammaproteobacteria bacterium]
MHRQQLLKLLGRHSTRFMEEAAFVRRAREFVQAHPDCFDRELLPAHVTGSAWVVNPVRSHVLMLHHRKHDQWFQPGGHADGDADILQVALRETAEETGVVPTQIILLSDAVFDVDIHGIPAGTHAPRHEHIDIRFLVEIDDKLPIPGNDESHDIGWVALHEVSRFNNNRSTYRMVEKTRQMRHAMTVTPTV